jgi:hypothetical protein
MRRQNVYGGDFADVVPGVGQGHFHLEVRNDGCTYSFVMLQTETTRLQVS